MNKINTKKGFALLMAVIVTSTLLLISFALSDISFKELVLSYTGRDSQIAFYAADSGVECAIFWDTKNPPPDGVTRDVEESAFSSANEYTINCSGKDIVTTEKDNGTGDANVPTIPNPSTTIIGGPESLLPEGNPTGSRFVVDLDDDPLDGGLNGPCAIVRVKKDAWANGLGATTTITSRGYNTCDINSPRRLERALEVVY